MAVLMKEWTRGGANEEKSELVVMLMKGKLTYDFADEENMTLWLH